ncbi:hypothetical protein J0S82_010660, partial [Galemys pyrenaicus]
VNELLTEIEAQEKFKQILLVLSCLHNKGIVHRDWKPENHLMDQHNSIKLADFGFSVQCSNEKLSMTVAARNKLLPRSTISTETMAPLWSWWHSSKWWTRPYLLWQLEVITDGLPSSIKPPGAAVQRPGWAAWQIPAGHSFTGGLGKGQLHRSAGNADGRAVIDSSMIDTAHRPAVPISKGCWLSQMQDGLNGDAGRAGGRGSVQEVRREIRCNGLP